MNNEVNDEKEKQRLNINERNRIVNKAKVIIETGKGERLTVEEEKVLKEITGVYYILYQNAVERMESKGRGDDDNER